MKVWTRQAVSEFVASKFEGYRFILVSNREPFQHTHVGTGIECSQPAGGLASALDPVMQACGGLWIAHGSGDADQETVDSFDHVDLPPDNPKYKLRRVWLSKEEHDGHYSGLSNEGLWPLCHVAFNRPIFDAEDWQTYRRVNQRFADAVLEEAGDDPAFVFIQDYHFALLPRMLRAARSNFVIAQFWHIPWPNREVFDLFPWKEEILDGLLGSDLLGFHLQRHCQNFLKTVDSSLEARVDESGSEICRRGHSTFVRPFPIGIDFDAHAELADSDAVARQMLRWRKELSLSGKLLGIGIDRLDYTKGIPERLRAFDRLLEENPKYRGKVVFAQIAVPSRSSLPAYMHIEQEVDYLTARMNRRWGTNSWRPVILLKKNYNPSEMIALHRLADFCVVSSLHDGMNLVAKEFAASRPDGDGVLVLSKFTGAANELKDALQVNPFSIEECANAYRDALNMPREERRRRMRNMREIVEESNIYRWAAGLLSEVSSLTSPKKYAPTAGPQPEFEKPALGVAV